MVTPAAAAVTAARESGDDVRLVDALLLSSGAAVFLGAFERADAELIEAERLSAQLPWAQAHTAITRGQWLLQRGDVGGGTAVLLGAERVARELGSPFTLATVLNMQATVLQAVGEDDAALAKHREAAELSVEVGTTWTLVYAVLGLAVAAARRGQPETAAELFAAGSASEEASSVAVSFPPDLAEVQRWLPVVRAELGEEGFRRAWERGRALRPDDVPRLAARITPAPG
jgi:ATP/maltotriose-dependent transcriptional regulator MalT